ncbi:MAG TPA: 3-phosphoshikimate 1-carboxyvinyltransferase [Lutibacter sp.]|nr:3-phosphoshikimate 1-carboxyvinyltransferase [Lutibacter sp.]
MLPGSKSESNRLLILQKLFPFIQIENLSNADDTSVLLKALNSEDRVIDIGHAGTAMRFLTAFFAVQEGKTTQLTGSKRMQERPIKVLVDALVELGAEIQYLKKDGFPPIEIKGKKLTKSKIRVNGNISSQYISALLLVAPSLSSGLEIELLGNITSIPYIKMTLSLLNKLGVKTSFKDKFIVVEPIQNLEFKTQNFRIEPDWSSASYYYSLAALQPNTKIELVGFKKNSLQGDSILPDIYEKLGIKTTFTNNGLFLESTNTTLNNNPLTFNLIQTPDLAQTIAVTCLGLGIECHLMGLHTLKIKETDRLQALKNELEKLGASVKITNDSLFLKSNFLPFEKDGSGTFLIKTYDDHRMAMAFAPLSVLQAISIENATVVSKSYPNFWEDWKAVFNT